MQLSFHKPSMPNASDTLPGRPEAIEAPGAHFVNGRPLAGPYPASFAVADIAMGCFWGAEKKFWSIPGVWVTAVGYQGGSTANHTYREACTGKTGHAEAVRIVYDPSVVSYERLLGTFWESHDPTQGYRQGNDAASRDTYEGELAKAGYGAITTEIREAPEFYFAEDYHQGYLAKNPNGYDCHTATGVACPIGVGVTAPSA
jgi:peptide-methionine (S)-S-oxide reductase